MHSARVGGPHPPTLPNPILAAFYASLFHCKSSNASQANQIDQCISSTTFRAQHFFPGDGAFFFVVAHGCVLLRHVFLVLWQFVVAHVCVAVLFPGLSCCFCGMPVRLRSVTGVRLKACALTRCFACNAATWLASARGTLRTMPSSTRSGVPVPSPLTFAPLHDQGMPAIHCGKRLLLCQ